MMAPNARRFRRAALIGLIGVLVIVIGPVMLQVWPLGADYYQVWRPLAENYLNGRTRLYGDYGTDLGFFNAPWTLAFIVPLAWMPLRAGMVALNIGSLLGIFACIRAIQREERIPLWALLMAAANLHTFDVLIRGQIDVIPLAGVILGWWALERRHPLALGGGLALMAVKPINVALVGLIYLIALRRWRIGEIALALGVPLALCVLSGFFVGFDWPLRFLAYTRSTQPFSGLSVTLWNAASALGLPVWPFVVFAALAISGLLVAAWRGGVDLPLIGLASATNLLFTTYANDSHYVLLIPAFVCLAWTRPPLTVLAYLATWTPLVRVSYGYGAAWIDIAYPLMLFAGLWLTRIMGRTDEQASAKSRKIVR